MIKSDENTKSAQNAIDYITHLCKTYGERITCTPAEKAASEDIAGKLKDFCDETNLDDFRVYPNLYPSGFIRITAAFVWVGIIFMFLDAPWSILATLLPIIGFLQLYITYVKMKEWFGFLFKSGTSYNAIGRIFPRNEKNEVVSPKTRIIIAGHTDSAFEFKITKHGDKIYHFVVPGFAYIIIQVLFGVIKTIMLSVGNPRIIAQGYGFTLIILDIIFLCVCIPGIPALIYLKNGLVGGTPVIGANDNLSGTGIALALGQYFSQPQHRLHNVELWVGSWGSEECGERGSEAFIQKYGPQGLLNNSFTIVPESCGAGDRLAIITKEPIHLAKHNLELCHDVYAGYETFLHQNQISDPIPCKVQKLPFSASDAGRFSLKGYKATMIIAFDGALAKPKNWHSAKDIPENLDLKVMTAVFGMIKHYILNLDQKLNP